MEELELDKDCQRGVYHYERKEHLSESPSEGRLMEGAPLLSRGLIPNNRTLLWLRTLNEGISERATQTAFRD